ncbi:hypothetical protein RCU48_08270 [Escherichia marmotae]|nr:hypothetical protein [Escherichia marmotae]
MSDKQERNISVELSDKTQPSVLRSIVGWGYEKIRHFLGRPGQLERAIASGELTPCSLKTPVDTLWARSVIYWQDWISPSWIPSDSRQCAIDFYKPGYCRGLERCPLVVPEVQNLISKEDIPHFSCDITDIQGISTSKSEEYDIGDIYEFPLLRCPGLVTPVNEEHLRENMQYWELRLHRMRFAEYPWTERKLYWLNEGGSHHFAAARYQACRLGISVPLTGRLSRFHVNMQMVSALCQQWHLFAIPADERLACFFRAMIAFECPFGNSELPRNMHNTIKSGVRLKLVWLERGHTKADIVADVLATAGFPDFGGQLKLLATSSLQKTHKLA